MDSLFSLDVTGEIYPEEPVVEVDSPAEEESSINVKNASESKDNVLERDTKLVKISLASHIRDIHRVDHSKNPAQYELYRNITMEIRKFIYNSIVSEDFCINCTVVQDSDQKATAEASGDQLQVGGRAQRNPGSSETLTCSEECAPRMDFDVEAVVSPKTSMSLDTANDVSSVAMDDMLEPLTSSEAESVGSEDSLQSLSLETSSQRANADPEGSGDFRASDCIMLRLSPAKLNRTVMEMAHVQMKRFFSSYPKNFKIATGHVGADVFAFGRRYYVSSDQASGELRLDKLRRNHVFYLAHLYRRQRSVCYYCGFLRCARSSSSKNPCEFQKCSKCVGTHKWSYNACKGNGKQLEEYLRTSDWRIPRFNVWSSQPKHVKELLRCFYCKNEGEANFKCQGLSCPEGLDTLHIRCLELLGKTALKQEHHRNPHLFPHMSRSDFVFTKAFKVHYKR
ncbi:conserved hypothetical protein [Theileria orientalis strain Shintoku]|uniref:Uncharacterized protein n=1 Tax=Theileria orientalis strain Shintoku TaxID=869250 RepID=J4CCG2_THEOR|nr:conserved hypothetical protein [Theileria orientalis strain Shintoku]BAM39337.1 conserved hypothetical protein [Theileria orientalis strain Shintoku]|eukprot:XP_009689638.1 conserved hypothetical protein [Theileria orientalis strain Shintoku]